MVCAFQPTELDTNILFSTAGPPRRQLGLEPRVSHWFIFRFAPTISFARCGAPYDRQWSVERLHSAFPTILTYN